MPTTRIVRRLIAVGAALATGCATALAGVPTAAAAGAAHVVINEVYGGGGNSGAAYTNDFIELYNPTDAAVDLTGWSVQYASGSSTSTQGFNQVTRLDGSIDAHGYYLVQQASGGSAGAALPAAQATGSINMSATSGAVLLADGATAVGTTCTVDHATNSDDGCAAGLAVTIDLVGYGSTEGHFEGDQAPGASNSTSIARTGGADTDDNAADFTAGAPTPGDADTGGGTPPPPVCTGTLSIAEIQGADTDTSPCVGDTVTTTGVVTANYTTGGFNGFYLQTAGSGTAPNHPDATPGASDAIFVYGSYGTGQVSVGDSVSVTGDVSEFQGTTEIGGHLTITKLDHALAAPVADRIPFDQMTTDAEREAHEGELIAPQGDFTVSSNYDVNYFGTFVLASGGTPLVQPTDAGPAGSPAAQQAAVDNEKRAITLDDGSSWSYYPDGDHSGSPLPWLTAGTPARVGSQVTFHQPVILRDEHSAWSFEPTAQVVGDGSAVATFSGNSRADNERPAEVGSDVTLATFNVENYFPTTGEQYVADGGTCSYYDDRDGTPIGNDRCSTDGQPGPRGAATEASFDRQQAKIVTGINRLDASIVSLEEIGNSVKFGKDRDYALAGLVDALNAAAGSEKWAYVPSPSAADLPPLDQQDVIRTALIYQPADVRPVGASHVLTGDSGAGQAFSIAREPLAQEFVGAGESDANGFLVVANHFKSKGADATGLFDDCPNGGDAENSDPAEDQGGFNCTRVHEAKDMMAFASATAKAAGTDRIFILGDLNAYTHEDPLQAMYEAGYTDLGSRFDPSEQTYNYNDLAGSLDHVLANGPALSMVTGADIWQINAQESVAYAYSRYNYNVAQLFDGGEPFAASDHNPVIVGLSLPGAPGWDSRTVYTAGDQVTFDGSTWQALWWTQNQRPGDPNGPWEQMIEGADGTAVWTPTRIFTAGDVVSHDGGLWRAKWWTRNQEPGASRWGPWESVGS